MNSRDTCYHCIHYSSTTNEEVGLCKALDDVSGPCYHVEPSNKKCLFDLKENPRTLTDEQAKLRDKSAERRREERMAFFEKISKEVQSWPEWKRKASYGQS